MIERYQYSEEGTIHHMMCDLSLIESAPDESKPILLWINIKYPTIDEPIEDLTAKLIGSLDATFVARKSEDEWIEFFFYASSAKGFENIAKEIVSGYEYDMGSFKDHKWSLYLDKLYPDSYQLILIQNQKIFAELSKEGDDFSIAREIEFYLSFQTPTSRDRAIEQIRGSSELKIADTIESDGDYSYSLIATIVASLDSELIDELSSMLYEIALGSHAIYEGWSTVLGRDYLALEDL